MASQEKDSKGFFKWTAILQVVLLVSLGLVLGSCATAPTKSQQKENREKWAREDLEKIKPSMSINFEKPLTLEDVITIGLTNNLELRVMDFDQEIASQETLANRLQMLPGLKASATVSERSDLRKSDVYNWLLDEDQKDYTVSELKSSTKADLALTWNVLDTVIAHVRSKQSDLHEQVLEHRKHRMAQKLALEITEAYWQAAALEDALDYLEVVKLKLKEIKAKVDKSVAERRMDAMDAKDAEMRLKELELTIHQLKSNLSTARLELAQLMGLNQNVQFTLARPPVKPIVGRLPKTDELDIDRLEEHAMKNRPDLFESDMNYLVQKEEAKAALLKLFPGVNFFAALHYDDNRLLYENTWNTVGAGVGWELLKLPSRIARLKGTEKSVDMAEVQRQMLTVGVITEVHLALLDYAIKVDRFRLLEDTYSIADQLLEMSADKYRLRQLSEMAVTQRQLEEMAAKLRRDEAVVDLLVAYKRLCVSVGIDPLDCDRELMGGRFAGRDLMASAGTDDGARLASYTADSRGGVKKWKCTECGYIHTGPEPPDVCPVCGAPKSAFVEVPFTEEDLDYDRKWSRSRSAAAARADDAPTRGWAGTASDKFLWKVQMGAFVKPGGPAKRIDQIKDMDIRLLDDRDAVVTTKRVHGQLFNRVRVGGLTQAEAMQLSQNLKRKGMEYWVIPPVSPHW